MALLAVHALQIPILKLLLLLVMIVKELSLKTNSVALHVQQHKYGIQTLKLVFVKVKLRVVCVFHAMDDEYFKMPDKSCTKCIGTISNMGLTCTPCVSGYCYD